ncbi:MAG: energy transducer TonB [Phenylobacterium sp.]|uniref:energy transducer TonB n=1 Tax=Phenylobacterium sp. TaxID=1871053 RepID=UPI00391BD479
MERERSRALVASALLHAGVVVATLISWPWSRELKIGSAVPVNIVASAPSADLRPAIQADEALPAQTEEPTPAAPPEPAAPEPTPQPEPTPPQPKAAPQPAPPPPQKAPTPAPKAPPQKAQPKTPPAKSSDDFLESLAADLAKSAPRSGGAPKSSAQQGASRPETAPDARQGAGQGLSASAMAGLADELQRRWNPNCEVEGGRDVRVRVTFRLGPGGRVVGEVSAGGQENSSNPVVRAAAERAVRAVHQAAPFDRLPREFYGNQIVVNFNAREACS